MDKTKRINLGGILFNIDEEAYNLLRKYLQDVDNRLRNTQGGAETIEDIELRIAEIFQSQGGSAGVITRDNIEAMISIIGKPEDFDISDEEAHYRRVNYRSSNKKRLYRNPDDRIIGGVCSGMGEYLNIDSVWMRVIFVIFAFFAGVGFFIYLALWLSLPSASTDKMKKEMYGDRYHSSGYSNAGTSLPLADSTVYSNKAVSSGFGNALNEVFRAFGRLFFIFIRLFLIIVGLIFVITGFITLVSAVMIFFFKYPGYFSTHACELNLFYLPDFLNYVVNPAVAPWILVLAFTVILMPLLAIIYWGVKMIIWFRARDGLFSLAGFVIWVISLAALSILLFNEGISYAETAKTGTEEVLRKASNDFYIHIGNKVAGLGYDKEISFPDNEYNIYFIDENKGLFITPSLKVSVSNDNFIKINIRKRSAGRSRIDATEKAEQLQYNYRLDGDTLFLDEYFTVPSGRKWSFDNVGVNLYIPEGTRIHFDQNTRRIFQPFKSEEEVTDIDSINNDDQIVNAKSGLHWIMTEKGLQSNNEPAEINK